MAEANTRLADRAWLERRYHHDGATVAAIAVEAGADPSSVWRWLERHGIALRDASPGRRTLAHLSDATIKAAVDRAEHDTAAAEALGVDLATLTERLARMGLRPWPGGSEGAKEMAAEYRAGAGIAAIAEARGLSVRTVRRRLGAAGVEMRPRGRPASTT